MDNIVSILIQSSLIESVKKYGIEGCESKIKNVYTHNEEIKQAMLNNLYNLYKFGGVK